MSVTSPHTVAGDAAEGHSELREDKGAGDIVAPGMKRRLYELLPLREERSARRHSHATMSRVIGIVS